MRIGLDVMGGDFAPKVTLDGAILAHKELPNNIKIVLIGDENIIHSHLKEANFDNSNFDIIPTTEVIEMGDQPTKAYPQKPNSSIVVGFNMLKKDEIQGFASAGNTGAMLVGSVYTIKAIEGVLRPCITTILPKENGDLGVLLDVGINPDAKPEVINQFAILGSIYAESVLGIKNPKIGLLNIGEEEEKGNLLSQAAYRLMKESNDINFIGNIESRDFFKDKADVIVCDGFTGNIALKLVETFYRMLMKRNMVDDYFARFNYENYGGTPILGVNSTVVVGHGISNAKAIKNMILLTRDVYQAQLSNKIVTAFQKYVNNAK